MSPGTQTPAATTTTASRRRRFIALAAQRGEKPTALQPVGQVAGWLQVDPAVGVVAASAAPRATATATRLASGRADERVDQKRVRGRALRA